MLLYIKSFARTSDPPSFNFQRMKGQIIEKRGERKRDRKNEGKKGKEGGGRGGEGRESERSAPPQTLERIQQEHLVLLSSLL